MYVLRCHNTITQYLGSRPILDLCLEVDEEEHMEGEEEEEETRECSGGTNIATKYHREGSQ